MEIIKIPIDDLVPYDDNAKQHPPEQLNRKCYTMELDTKYAEE